MQSDSRVDSVGLACHAALTFSHYLCIGWSRAPKLSARTEAPVQEAQSSYNARQAGIPHTMAVAAILLRTELKESLLHCTRGMRNNDPRFWSWALMRNLTRLEDCNYGHIDEHCEQPSRDVSPSDSVNVPLTLACKGVTELGVRHHTACWCVAGCLGVCVADLVQYWSALNWVTRSTNPGLHPVVREGSCWDAN